MGIFSHFGKNKSGPEMDEAQKEKIDKATESYKNEREEFEKRIRVDLPPKSEQVDKTKKPDATGDAEDTEKPEREKFDDLFNKQDDDDRVR